MLQIEVQHYAAWCSKKEQQNSWDSFLEPWGWSENQWEGFHWCGCLDNHGHIISVLLSLSITTLHLVTSTSTSWVYCDRNNWLQVCYFLSSPFTPHICDETSDKTSHPFSFSSQILKSYSSCIVMIIKHMYQFNSWCRCTFALSTTSVWHCSKNKKPLFKGRLSGKRGGSHGKNWQNRDTMI